MLFLLCEGSHNEIYVEAKKEILINHFIEENIKNHRFYINFVRRNMIGVYSKDK